MNHQLRKIIEPYNVIASHVVAWRSNNLKRLLHLRYSQIRNDFSVKKAFSLVEVILSIGLLMMIVLGVASSILFSEQSLVSLRDRNQAVNYAEESIEAVRNIRDESFSALADGTYGLGITGNQWVLTGTSDVQGAFTRQIAVSTISSSVKRVTTTITWPGNSFVMTADYTYWSQLSYTPTAGGMLVYGDGGTTTDTIRYRLLSSSTGTWGTVQTTADVDSGTTNKALVSLKLYSSKTRNEKILISKHCVGITTSFYGQVWDGSVWGDVQLLSTFGNCSNPQIENYSGTYQSRSGDFVVAYSDNSGIPKYRVWNGSSWSAQLSATNNGQAPQWLQIESRPTTNELMLRTFDSGNDVETQYFNGGSYLSTANWSAVTSQTGTGGLATAQVDDFEWSPVTPTAGLLVFAQTNNDTSVSGRPFTANGAGSGTWGTVVNATALASRFDNSDLTARPAGAAEFMSCNKARNAPTALTCNRASTTSAWTLPTNSAIATGLNSAGSQMGFDFEYEKDGANGLVVYADETTTPKFKKYVSSTNTFDAAATNLTATVGVTKSVKLKPSTDNNDIMIMTGDANGDFYTQIFDGTNNAIYSSPSGKAFTAQGTNGYASNSFYYDFAWDETLPNIAHIQNNVSLNGSTASLVTSFNNPVTANNTVVVAISSWRNTATCPMTGGSVVDSKGNTYTQATEVTTTSGCMSIWYARAVTGGSSFSVTVSTPGSTLYSMTVGIHEYRGIISVSPVDKFVTASGTSTTPNSGNMAATANANDLIFGAFMQMSGANVVGNPGANFSFRVDQPTSAVAEALYTEDRIVGVTGIYAANITLASSQTWRAVVVALKGS